MTFLLVQEKILSSHLKRFKVLRLRKKRERKQEKISLILRKNKRKSKKKKKHKIISPFSKNKEKNKVNLNRNKLLELRKKMRELIYLLLAKVLKLVIKVKKKIKVVRNNLYLKPKNKKKNHQPIYLNQTKLKIIKKKKQAKRINSILSTKIWLISKSRQRNCLIKSPKSLNLQSLKKKLKVSLRKRRVKKLLIFLIWLKKLKI